MQPTHLNEQSPCGSTLSGIPERARAEIREDIIWVEKMRSDKKFKDDLQKRGARRITLPGVPTRAGG
jgi:hypothetical protein